MGFLGQLVICVLIIWFGVWVSNSDRRKADAKHKQMEEDYRHQMRSSFALNQYYHKQINIETIREYKKLGLLEQNLPEKEKDNMRKWKYQLENEGKALRNAIHNGNGNESLDKCIEALISLEKKLGVHESEAVEIIDELIDEIKEELADDNIITNEQADYYLNEFYDLMDNMDVWVGL